MKCVLLVVAFVLGTKEAIGADGQVRALWVVRDTITTPREVSDVVDFADAHGFNTLFVQVRGRGDAYYKSFFVPGPETEPQIPASFDPLAAIISEAHNRGIEVHAWLNMYLTASMVNPPTGENHLYNQHPSWFMVSLNGRNMAIDPLELFEQNTIEGAYLSPGLAEVRNYLTRVVTEVVVIYDIDGIHLDYVRYPGRNFDFTYRTRLRFSGLYDADPVDVVTRGEEIDPTLELLSKWVDFRVEQIDEQVRSIARRIELSGKNILLSAAVKPDAVQAYYEYGQNWIGWLADDLVDFVVPMCYFPETDWVEDVLNDSLRQVDRSRIIGGIGVYKLDTEGMIDQIVLMNELGLRGYSLFSYTTFTENPSFARALDSLNR